MIQIRRGVFETNSSSTHSITMCMKSDFDEWKNGHIYYNEGYPGKQFVQKDEAFELLRSDKWDPVPEPEKLYGYELERVMRDHEIYTFDSYDHDYLEWYDDSFTTPSGETVVAFGWYGHD